MEQTLEEKIIERAERKLYLDRMLIEQGRLSVRFKGAAKEVGHSSTRMESRSSPLPHPLFRSGTPSSRHGSATSRLHLPHRSFSG